MANLKANTLGSNGDSARSSHQLSLDWIEEVLLHRVDDDAVAMGLDEGILGIPELDGFLTANGSDPIASIRAFTGETNWYAYALYDEEEVTRPGDSITPNVRAIHTKWLAERPGPHHRASRSAACRGQRSLSLRRRERVQALLSSIVG